MSGHGEPDRVDGAVQRRGGDTAQQEEGPAHVRGAQQERVNEREACRRRRMEGASSLVGGTAWTAASSTGAHGREATASHR